MNEEEIKVSAICAAYNQETYIRQCLEGILMQETDFRFEVIVHDDASIDNTPQIIREYADRYPGIVIPVLEKENRYSQEKNSGSMS